MVPEKILIRASERPFAASQKTNRGDFGLGNSLLSYRLQWIRKVFVQGFPGLVALGS
jgi:hypothetical protein